MYQDVMYHPQSWHERCRRYRQLGGRLASGIHYGSCIVGFSDVDADNENSRIEYGCAILSPVGKDPEVREEGCGS